jgi:hypothetical protein
MLLYGKQDTTVKIKNIKSLSQRIKGAGGQVITHYYSGLDHTGLIGSLSIPLRNGRTVLSDIIQFSKNVSANKTLSSTP